MKAEYVKPYVTVEAFDPNVAVASCPANATYTFDCLYGSEADNANLISYAMGLNCNNNCGFADYFVDADGDGKDDSISGAEGYSDRNGWIQTQSNVAYSDKSGDHSAHNDTLTWDGQTLVKNDKYNPNKPNSQEYVWSGNWTGKVTATGDNFLGWLFIGRNEGEGPNAADSYTMPTYNFADGLLKLATTFTHLLIAPVYGARATDVGMS